MADNSMFKQFGVDTRSEEEKLSEMQSARVGEALKQGQKPGRFAGDSALRQAGALIGGAITKPKLSPQQQRDNDATDAARAAIETQMNAGMYRGADGKVDFVRKAEGFQKELAKALTRSGDSRGIDMLVQIGHNERSRAKDERERAKDMLDIESKEQSIENREYTNSRRVVDAAMEVWPTTSTDPNDSAFLYIDSDGNALNPDTKEVVYPAGEFSTNAPIPPEFEGTDAEAMPKWVQDLMPSDKERGLLNRRQRDLTTQLKLNVGVRDAMADAVNADGSINVMAGGGSAQGWVIRTLDNIRSATRGIGKSITIYDKETGKAVDSYDGTIAGANRFLKKNEHLTAGIDWGRLGIDRKDTRSQARMAAVFVQLAYGKARLNEENGRISDVDFEHAWNQIAANATDPEALRQVLVGDMTSAVEDYEQWRGQQHPSTHRFLFQPGSDKQYFDARNNFFTAFGQSFGTAAQAGAGLTNPQGDTRADLTPRDPDTGEVQVTAPEITSAEDGSELRFNGKLITEMTPEEVKLAMQAMGMEVD